MKKEYIIPATIITEATTHAIICTSADGTIYDENGNVIGNIDRSQPGTDGDDAGTKGRGWEVFGEE